MAGMLGIKAEIGRGKIFTPSAVPLLLREVIQRARYPSGRIMAGRRCRTPWQHRCNLQARYSESAHDTRGCGGVANLSFNFANPPEEKAE